MVSILPTGMIGPNYYNHLTPTMHVFDKIINNKLPMDPNFYFNFIDIRDVAKTMILAEEKGENGGRYLLSQHYPICSTDLFRIAHSVNSNVKIPKKANYVKLILMAKITELISTLTNKNPELTATTVKRFYNTKYIFDSSKAKKELGFRPRNQEELVKEVFEKMNRKR